MGGWGGRGCNFDPPPPVQRGGPRAGLPVVAPPKRGLQAVTGLGVNSLPERAVLGSSPAKGANHEDQDFPVFERSGPCAVHLVRRRACAGARWILPRTRPLRQTALRLSVPSRRDRAAPGVRSSPRRRVSP